LIEVFGDQEGAQHPTQTLSIGPHKSPLGEVQIPVALINASKLSTAATRIAIIDGTTKQQHMAITL